MRHQKSVTHTKARDFEHKMDFEYKMIIGFIQNDGLSHMG